MSLRRRARAFALISLALAIGLGGAFYFANLVTIAATDALLHAMNTQRMVSELQIVTTEFANRREARPLAQARAKLDEIEAAMARAHTAAASSSEARYWPQAAQEVRSIRHLLAALAVAGKGELEQEARLRTFTLLLLHTQSLVNHIDQAKELRFEELKRMRVARNLCMALLLATVFAALGASIILFDRAVLRPLDRLRLSLQVIARGNRDLRLHSPRNDEFGQVEQAFDEMLDRLEEMTVSRERLEAEALQRRRAQQEAQQRAAELEATNRDLESFSYSISHDLQAPLRAMNGYARILQEECAGRLDETERRYLESISGNAQRMADLIDGLLAFSRLGRQALHLAPVPMNELVREVIAGLDEWGGRRVEMVVRDLPEAMGDRGLIRQVWFNLLANAVKFTRPREVARISVDAVHCCGEIHYRVSDNGIGFDAACAGKLFGVFQRLHPEQGFEGNGVGLAIAQRIVLRHRGRIWAEGSPDRGATFCFTLPCAAAPEPAPAERALSTN